MSLKTEYILKVSYFLLEIICYKLPQHQNIVFSFGSKQSVYMVLLTMLLTMGSFNKVEKQVAYPQNELDRS